MDDLDHALTAIPPVKLKSAILLGDFNIDLLPSHHPVTNPSFQALQHLTCNFNLTQVVTEATRTVNNKSSLIDHVYTSDSALLKSCVVSQPLGSSDHNSVSMTLGLSSPPIKKYKRCVWFYSRADFDSFSDDLLKMPHPETRLTSTQPGSTGKPASFLLFADLSPTD